MTIFSLYIVNRNGSLVFHRNFNQQGPDPLSHNDHLRVASTFHGLHAIAAEISPEPDSSGIELVEADSFKLQCFQTLTGMKFFILANIQHGDLQSVLHQVYELYSDYVLKNPFHTLDMPVKSELFDLNLEQLVADNPK
eukprot:gnl/Spiro4/23958_TR11865_c0_g1_i1.p1 gnl/Spiro4/23958_TR11865_c0_g1~~gnl/Spiro4/23958_TR11865_c0_g1_i1.p1  ORF type:complete len:157 (+),score=42.55 gnl/Spiro4/23958_TR11865_c0_g1_i1:58-471(+)